ncbi:hypothetical protein ACH4SP_11950 [Streptomyces sp. NPDC021093]|uniref:hypothetical protein n=1 Tax=Streptomyces sp. NPDC021093 TaxID=3365112 RepID=UPI0037BC1570
MSFLAKTKQQLALAAAVGTLAATAGVAATATPAAAAAATTDANFAGVFIYANPNYSIPVYPSGAPVTVGELTGSGKDSTSSIGNSTNLSMCFYEHKNYGGLEFRIGPGEWWATIPNWINDKISSYRPC